MMILAIEIFEEIIKFIEDEELRYKLIDYHNKSYLMNSLDFLKSIKYGCLNIIKYFHEEFLYNKEWLTAMDYASMYGHLHIIQWLNQNRKEGNTVLGVCWAAMNGHLHVVRWFYSQNIYCKKTVLEFAIRKCQYSVVTWLQQN